MKRKWCELNAALRLLMTSLAVWFVMQGVAANGQGREPSGDRPPAARRERGEGGATRRGRGGFAGPRQGKRAGRGLWSRMSDDERAEFEVFMEEHFPKMFLEMQALQERNPDGFDRRIGLIVYVIRQMMDLLETQPERGALMIQERQLKFQMRRQARRYQSAKNPKGREKAKDQFRELCALSFDCRHQRREMEIRELEARIAELQLRHEEAATMRDELIDQEVEAHLSPERGPRGPKGRRPKGPRDGV